MKFETNREKSAYYSSYFPLLREYSENSDFTSSNGMTFDGSVDFFDFYDASIEFRSRMFGEMLRVVTSTDIKEENFSDDLKSLMKKIRTRIPKELLEEYPHG